MKKNFCKLMALAIAALMMMSTLAFAENPTVDATDVATTTVTLTGLTAGEEATVLVVKSGTDLETLANTSIVFIDQVTINAEGNAVFTMDISGAADAENGVIDMVDVYCGYTSMEGAALSALNIPVEEEIVEAPQYDLAKSEIKSGNFSKSGFKRVFLKITEPGVWTLTHSSANSAIYYSTERGGYDCLLETTAATIEDVIKEITATKVAPVDDMIITKYGDLDANTRFGAPDAAVIKNYVKRVETNDTMGIKKLLIGDADGNSRIGAPDAAEIKNAVKRVVTEMSVASQNK